jgi:hypothetical protein
MLLMRTVLPSCLAPIHAANQQRNRRSRNRPSLLASWITVVLCLSFVGSQAWGEISTEEKRGIVAAGFGYQIGSTAAIAVKVYDAGSGNILSDDVYDLTVMENDSAGSKGEPRIFAGGVGLGATDLSNFVLRVYDANTGAFQWEGQLNLVQSDRKGGGQVVSAGMPRRATVTKRLVVETANKQPVFLLRALDAMTGSLVWEDEFTTARSRIPHIQQIVGRSILSDELSTTGAHTFDFRIRMYDPSGQKVLWEDQLSRSASDEGPLEPLSDHARILPAWPTEQLQEESVPELI